MKETLQKKKTLITIIVTLLGTWFAYFAGYDASTGIASVVTLGEAVALTGVQATLFFQKLGQNRVEDKIDAAAK
jgi:hypothetical protein